MAVVMRNARLHAHAIGCVLIAALTSGVPVDCFASPAHSPDSNACCADMDRECAPRMAQSCCALRVPQSDQATTVTSVSLQRPVAAIVALAVPASPPLSGLGVFERDTHSSRDTPTYLLVSSFRV